VSPGTSEGLISQIDLAASFAALTEQEIDFRDSKNLMDALLGRTPSGRKNLILEASGRMCFREDNWVMIPPYDGPAVFTHVNIESGISSEYQLYDLSEDPSQKYNLASERPDKLEELIDNYESAVGSIRDTR
jgi:arylsulfatase A-like enzyme